MTAVAEHSAVAADDTSAATSERTRRLGERLKAAVGVERVLTDHSQLRTYECDGLANFRVTPAVVVLAESRQHVAPQRRPGPRRQLLIRRRQQARGEKTPPRPLIVVRWTAPHPTQM